MEAAMVFSSSSESQVETHASETSDSGSSDKWTAAAEILDNTHDGASKMERAYDILAEANPLTSANSCKPEKTELIWHTEDVTQGITDNNS